MKYYFTNNCYWDSEKLLVFRDDSPVDLPSSYTKILAKLLKNNGHFVRHEELYYAMTGVENLYGDWKASLSNKFTRNKASEKGLLIRVPEINPFFEKSKSLTGGGYKIGYTMQTFFCQLFPINITATKYILHTKNIFLFVQKTKSPPYKNVFSLNHINC